MAYLPALLTLCAAVLAVFGKSWNSDLSGLARVTLKGWLAIALSIISAGLTVRTIAIDTAEKNNLRQSAHAELVSAADRLLSPFRAIYIRYKGPRFLPPAPPMREHEALARLHETIPATALQDADFVAYLSHFNALQHSGHIRDGMRLPYVDSIALRTAEGGTALEKTLQLGGESINLPIRKIVLDIVRDRYRQSIEARPAALRNLPDKAQRTVLPITGGERVVSAYKDYVAKVDQLRQKASTEVTRHLQPMVRPDAIPHYAKLRVEP